MNTLQLDPTHESEKIIDFIAHTFKQANKSTAVIALSGGIDSALSLMLAAKAIGAKHIHAFHLPAKTSNPVHETDARAAAQAAGLPETNFHIIRIGSIIQKTWRIIKHYEAESNSSFLEAQDPQGVSIAKSLNETNRLRLANIAARTRMMVIYDQAKEYDALVIGTENYSEHLLGYFTRFGDEASDIEPIRHLYKTQVIQLAQHLGVPESIITKPPSADLWKGQTDAKELGFTYDQADPILSALDQGETTDSLKQAYDGALVDAIAKQMQSVAYKHHVPYSLK